MTVMIDQFFGLHPAVIRSGFWAKMRPGEKDLYVYLMAESERQCTRELKRTDEEIRAGVGTPARTLCRARKCLAERGLVQYKKIGGNKVAYVICDPATYAPYPGDPRQRVQYLKRSGEVPANHGQSAQVKSLPDTASAPTPEAPHPDGVMPRPVQEAKCLRGSAIRQEQVDQCSEAEPACPSHQNRYLYFDSKGERHCQRCNPSPYAPPADSPVLKPTRLQDVAAGHDQANARRPSRKTSQDTPKRIEPEKRRVAGMTPHGLSGLFS